EEDQSLGSFIEKLSELGQEAAAENSKEQTFAQRVCKILHSDADREEPVYLKQLGPHRLVNGELDWKTSLRLLPVDLWSESLALMIELVVQELWNQLKVFDPSLLTTDALARVFDAPRQRLLKLLVRSRSLLVVDLDFNRLVNEVIEDEMRKLKQPS
ncbi:MAG TPA: hypothetical protein VK639_01065, partial [Terriglobales bacterium]|nr:hypothetical protein [Terriglobales bacterium]